jgi:type IV pilus assembly protein PilM
MDNVKLIIKDIASIRFDTVFGLDIGDRSIEIIELSKMLKFSVSTYARMELSSGIVENGRIIDANVLAENIKSLLRSANHKKVSTNKVIISLPESQVYTQCFFVDANLKGANLQKDIVEKVSLLLPININNVYWDYIEKIIPGKEQKSIIFVSIPKDIANSYVRFCNSIGLEVVSLYPDFNSLGGVVLREENKPYMIMDIGSNSTNLHFFSNTDSVNMSLSIPVAGEQMTAAVVTGLKKVIVEAESLKIKHGFSNDQDNPVRPLIMPVMNGLLEETISAIAYYEEMFGEKIENVYMIGGSVLLPGIVDVFKTYLGREVQIATPNKNINFNSLEIRNFPLFAGVMGLGMLGATGQFKELNILRKMPKAEINSIKKLSLFDLGYLSKINTVRVILNNKVTIIILAVIIGLIFVVLIRQAQNFGLVKEEIVMPQIIKRLPPTNNSTSSSIMLPIVNPTNNSTSSSIMPPIVNPTNNSTSSSIMPPIVNPTKKK